MKNPNRRPRRLVCCCCGKSTQGRQWWNRDTGFGLCVSCADMIAQRETPEEMARSYGRRGYHYYLPEVDAEAEARFARAIAEIQARPAQ